MKAGDLGPRSALGLFVQQRLIEDQTVDASTGFDIVNAWVLAWSRVHSGDTSAQPLLFGDVVVSDAALDVP